MVVEPSVYKVSDNSKLHKNALKELIAKGTIPENVFFDVTYIIDFERYKVEETAYLILEWTYSIPGIVHFIAETRWKIKNYKSPAQDDVQQVSTCIVLGMANYMAIFLNKTDID